MKTLSLLAFTTAAAAFVAGARLEVVTSVLFAAGLAAILIQDYGPRAKPLPMPQRARRKLQPQFRPPALLSEPNRLAA
jgi:hypothetical protein